MHHHTWEDSWENLTDKVYAVKLMTLKEVADDKKTAPPRRKPPVVKKKSARRKKR